MATRRVKRKKGPGKVSRTLRPSSPKPRPSSPLPNGSYAWRGKGIPFARLPKQEQARHRSRWASQAGKTRSASVKVAASRKTERDARAWVKRRTAWVPKHGAESQYAGMVPADQITLSAATIQEIRKIQAAAHKAYKDQGHGGGPALRKVEKILDALGPELASIMPQLWWYH